MPCDRFSLLWDLRSEVRRPDYDLESLLAARNIVLSSRIVEVEGRSGRVALEVVKDISLDLDQEFLLVEIPYDFYRMLRETNVTQPEVKDIPLIWRMKSREVFQRLFQRGYRIIDFIGIEREGRKRDFYILKIDKR